MADVYDGYRGVEVIEALAKGEMTSALLRVAAHNEWGDAEAGAVSTELRSFLDRLEGTLYETGAAGNLYAEENKLSPEARQYLLGVMGRSKKRPEFNSIRTTGRQKELYGKTVTTLLWGGPETIALKEAGKFTGSIKLAKRFAKGAYPRRRGA